MAAFVKSQPPINITSSKHFRYSNSIKQFALKIHFLCPKVYRILRIPWALPSPRTLQRVTEKWEFSPGFNDLLFKILEMKGSTMTPKNKECVLCFNVFMLVLMSVKAFLYYHTVKDRIIGFHNTNSVKTYEYAKSVMVIMIRGLHATWKQPLCFFFVSSTCSGYDLHNIIFTCIQKLLNKSFNVRVMISDLGSN